MHLGMTGWVHIRGEQTALDNSVKKTKESDKDEWPPRFCKFHLKTEGKPEVEVAFTDARRLGRVRLVDCPGKDIRKYSPLVENGPDPVIDLDIFTEQYLKNKMRSRHVPIKAFLLDQTMISGIGNWVADETLYHAKLHPEQYCDEFSDAEITSLFKSIRYVCQTAVDKLGDSGQFPEHWLFSYRWGKGSKGHSLPNGETLAFIKVGGRTSCYVPAVQKKTGHIPPKAETMPFKGATGDEASKKPSTEKAEKRKETAKRKPELAEDETNAPATAPTKKKTRKMGEHDTEPSDETRNVGSRRSTRLRGK
ncbi:Formamidopyrimidine-DNA glycosylase-like protein [Hapsidospora chrysogenum ATCC 11550]|uniref:Formamidopyrimidine-DNA glycosylase-like protein n=1 Tax=Hapsidospora chrysogenum (strain ATCC 11550 / CBS 779.69 / DSM 880 / IAM 14645 / JCM 23072 / IMI 49137) TaxID=857340 RepID=A0A086SVK2_HAPC1|nr:Formamidopyrimidine-DNA glycosylase-like protein [Hapsidospora chrysogenum ATCC 11550]